MSTPNAADPALTAAVEKAVDDRLPQIRAKLTSDNADTLDTAGHPVAAEFLRGTITR